MKEVRKCCSTAECAKFGCAWAVPCDNAPPREAAVLVPAKCYTDGFCKTPAECKGVCKSPGRWEKPSDQESPKVQPTAPTPVERDSVVAAVRADLLARSEMGLKKYGVPLSGAGLTHRAWLQHAYEEALDMANYLKCALLTMPQ